MPAHEADHALQHPPRVGDRSKHCHRRSGDRGQGTPRSREDARFMTTPLTPLPTIMIEPLVRSALLEDLGRAGDLTTDAIAPADLVVNASLVARQSGVVAGLDLVGLAFRLIDERSK